METKPTRPSRSPLSIIFVLVSVAFLAGSNLFTNVQHQGNLAKKDSLLIRKERLLVQYDTLLTLKEKRIAQLEDSYDWHVRYEHRLHANLATKDSIIRNYEKMVNQCIKNVNTYQRLFRQYYPDRPADQ